MAVAGLRDGSMLKSSYLVENYAPVSSRWGNKERSTTRTSSIRKMLGELDSEHIYEQNRSQQTSDGGLENPCSCSSKGGMAENEDAPMDANEVENEYPQNRNPRGLQNEQEDNNSLCLQRSPAIGVTEKERVRKIFHEWGSKSLGDHTSNGSCVNTCLRAHWLGENECKRVRIVKEWMELSNQQGDTCLTDIEEQATDIDSQIKLVRDGLVDNNCGVGVRRPIRRLYGRQALLDLIAKFERERIIEIQGLLENRLVSSFAHRNRIQTLLKGRFLHNRRFIPDEKHTSVAANELGLLRQTHAVSDIRKGFLSRLNNYEHHTQEGAKSQTSSDNDMKSQSIQQAQETFQEIPNEIADELETTDMESDWETYTHGSPLESIALGERHEHVLEDQEREQLPPTVEYVVPRSQDQDDLVERNLESSAQIEEWHEPVTDDDDNDDGGDDCGWHHLTRIELNQGVDVSTNENEHGWYQETGGSDFQESHEEWYDDNVLEEPTENWFNGTSYQEAATVGRTDVFYSTDDDNGNRFELRELMSRRRVSNLLQSDFRVRLDQLIQSYVERQEQASESNDEWIHEQQTVDENTGDMESIERTEGSSLTVIPQTHLDNGVEDAADQRFPDIHQHLGTEWEIINGLRIDMARVQQRMNDMQRMLEACMNMQVELQRSVQQEVHLALNQSSNSREALEVGMLKDEAECSRGNERRCFLCCNNSSDSLPNRCGFIYVCSKCVDKIDWSKLKESVTHP